jgi:hypothetical protein
METILIVVVVLFFLAAVAGDIRGGGANAIAE